MSSGIRERFQELRNQLLLAEHHPSLLPDVRSIPIYERRLRSGFFGDFLDRHRPPLPPTITWCDLTVTIMNPLTSSQTCTCKISNIISADLERVATLFSSQSLRDDPELTVIKNEVFKTFTITSKNKKALDVFCRIFYTCSIHRISLVEINQAYLAMKAPP